MTTTNAAPCLLFIPKGSDAYVSDQASAVAPGQRPKIANQYVSKDFAIFDSTDLAQPDQMRNMFEALGNPPTVVIRREQKCFVLAKEDFETRLSKPGSFFKGLKPAKVVKEHDRIEGQKRSLVMLSHGLVEGVVLDPHLAKPARNEARLKLPGGSNLTFELPAMARPGVVYVSLCLDKDFSGGDLEARVAVERGNASFKGAGSRKNVPLTRTAGTSFVPIEVGAGQPSDYAAISVIVTVNNQTCAYGELPIGVAKP